MEELPMFTRSGAISGRHVGRSTALAAVLAMTLSGVALAGPNAAADPSSASALRDLLSPPIAGDAPFT
jgi:hypothetical protein